MIICQSRRIATATSDPNWGSVKLLMGFEGPNGSITTGFADESGAVHGTMSGGNTSFSSITTTQKVFGSSCLRLAGNGCYFPYSGDWVLGSGSFTLETFFRLTTVLGNTYALLANFGGTTGQLGWVLYINTAGELAWNASTTGADNLNDMTGTTVLTINTWHHACIDFDGSKYRLYLDGVMEASFSTPRTLYDPTMALGVGMNSIDSGLWFPGYLDEVRITKGVARYHSDSGFAVPTASFPRS
jgi:hypothetical protein